MTMETTREKPNCYQCKYRGGVPGDAHSICRHPQGAGETGDSFDWMLGDRGNPAALGIRANLHGIRMGWFMWPFNFDPVWLEECRGFTSVAEKTERGKL